MKLKLYSFIAILVTIAIGAYVDSRWGNTASIAGSVIMGVIWWRLSRLFNRKMDQLYVQVRQMDAEKRELYLADQSVEVRQAMKKRRLKELSPGR